MADLIARTDRSLIRAGARSVRHVVVTVAAPLADRSAERPPADVAFVLDRSGSMGGEKIVLARDAILQGIAMLKPSDRFTVVAYDNHVDVVMPLTTAHREAREAAEHQLRGIDARGTTDLGGGWLAGCQQLAEAPSPSAMSRCLLMSDGCANQGITAPEDLERHARALQLRGVVTSTFGVGADFDERLMTGMARAGGGNGYFIQQARQIGDLITSELAEALELVARNAKLSLALPRGTQVEVLSDFDVTDGPETEIALRSLVSGQSLTIVLKLTFPAGTEGESARLKLRLSADESAVDATAEVEWTWASHARNDAQRRDSAVDLQVAQVYAARARRDALDLNRQGDFKGARRLLEHVARRIDGYAGASPELRALAEALRREAREVEERMEAATMKAMHHMALGTLQSRLTSGKAQRSRFDAEAYTLQVHRGIPVFESDGARLAVVTGSPVSFASRPFRLMGQTYQLPATFGGITPETIGRHAGTHLDGVIGGDILARYECLLDAGQRRLVLSRGALGCDGMSLRTPLHLNVPSAEVRIGARTGVALIDTGTRLSYIDPAAVTGQPAGREKDFFPALGEFETDVYDREIELAGLRVRGRFGVLPPALQQSLKALGAQWIIGSDLLTDLPLLLDLAHHRIMLVQQQPSFLQAF